MFVSVTEATSVEETSVFTCLSEKLLCVRSDKYSLNRKCFELKEETKINQRKVYSFYQNRNIIGKTLFIPISMNFMSL